jgi:ABC-type polar amino acid transport system ATPase subunit
VIFIDQGRILEEASPHELFEPLREERRRQFLSQVL